MADLRVLGDYGAVRIPRAGAYIEAVIREILASRPDLFSLPLPDKVQIGHKYNEFVPRSC